MGGAILNVMPCVLPVISIKILSIVEQARDDKAQIAKHGLIFSSGILVSFLLLAVIVILIQQAGVTIGWGFQFQQPLFVVIMSLIVTLLAMSLFGAFFISLNLGQNQLSQLSNKEGAAGAFFNGVLATVLATPCTAPFLGTALGFAFTQAWWLVMLIFLVIGIGMALPYLLLTLNPGWMRFIPKPGDWMETFKQSMGFVLLATVLWLLYVLGSQIGLDGMFKTASFLMVTAFTTWLASRLVDLNSSTARRYCVYGLTSLICLGTFFSLVQPSLQNVENPKKIQVDAPALDTSIESARPSSKKPDKAALEWIPFSVDKLNEALSQDKTVFLDFTADWCLTCKVNEKTVIDTEPVIKQMKALNVVTMKADWTKRDNQITELLRKFGRSGVPLYVIFPAGKPQEPIILPEIINQTIVLDGLVKAGVSK